MKTIEPDIQEQILDILPSDGNRALAIMHQMLANMILSIDGASYEKTIKDIEVNLVAYKGN